MENAGIRSELSPEEKSLLDKEIAQIDIDEMASTLGDTPVNESESVVVEK